MTAEKKVKMYLAIDGINGDREEFETIDEARMWLEECFLDPAEGYHPDFASCKIYQLAETVECDVVDKKENYKYTNEGDIPEDDNESEAWPYDTSFDEIWKHRFVPHAAQQKPPSSATAEEIIESILESLGDPINIHNHAFEIRPYTVDHKTEWWIFHNGVGSGEPLAQWLNEFATLHAQQKSEMSMDMVRALREFHTAFNLPQRDTPTIIPDNEFQLRHKILVEEVGELSDAYFVGDIVEVADAITDCLYVLIGTALQFGIADKLEACFDEVHRSNMSKLGSDGYPIMREDGKIMKGPNFVRPDLNKVLAGPSDYSEQKSEIKMPTKEAIVQYFNNHFNCHADVIIGDYETTETAMTVDAVLKLVEWLRNQITEK